MHKLAAHFRLEGEPPGLMRLGAGSTGHLEPGQDTGALLLGLQGLQCMVDLDIIASPRRQFHMGGLI